MILATASIIINLILCLVFASQMIEGTMKEAHENILMSLQTLVPKCYSSCFPSSTHTPGRISRTVQFLGHSIQVILISHSAGSSTDQITHLSSAAKIVLVCVLVWKQCSFSTSPTVKSYEPWLYQRANTFNNIEEILLVYYNISWSLYRHCKRNLSFALLVIPPATLLPAVWLYVDKNCSLEESAFSREQRGTLMFSLIFTISRATKSAIEPELDCRDLTPSASTSSCEA